MHIQRTVSKNCIYSMLIKDFVDLIENLLDKYSHVKIEAMGFPENWKEILIK